MLYDQPLENFGDLVKFLCRTEVKPKNSADLTGAASEMRES